MVADLSQFSHLAAYLFLAIAFIGAVYSAGAFLLVRHLGRVPCGALGRCPCVTILKPLHGAEPHLYENLVSFCRQDFAGEVQVVLGVQDDNDPAIGVVRRLIADLPDADIELVVDSRSHGSNRKIGNLINMVPFARNDVLVISDSDVRVAPDYLGHVIAALDQPDIGLVTCLYRGHPGPGLASKLSSMAIDYHFLPSVLVGMKLGLARPCFGSTMALRREMLQRIGGLEAFANVLADDNAIGEAVRRTGARVAVPAIVVSHDCSPRRASDVLYQELRWARTIRGIAPGGYAGSIITHPLPMALLAVLLGDFDIYGAAIIAMILACRLAMHCEIDNAIGAKSWRWHLGPLRDLMSFLVFLASYFISRIRWRDHEYRVNANGTISDVNMMAR